MNSRLASSDTGRAVPPRSGSFLRRVPPPEDPRPAVVAFPYAGAGAAALHDWARLLAPDCHLLPVHLPGREQRFHERPYRRMTHLIRDLVDEIGPLVERGCTFWGHSMGAAISVALTRELVDQGLPPPVQLIVSGAGAPDRRGMTNPAHVLDDERLIARLRQYEGTPRAVLDDPDLLSLLLPVIRADFELLETWSSPRAEPLPAPITVLYGEDDASVSDFQLAGWTSYGTVPVDIRRYSGGHFFIREHAAEIADVIRGLVRHAARRGR